MGLSFKCFMAFFPSSFGMGSKGGTAVSLSAMGQGCPSSASLTSSPDCKGTGHELLAALDSHEGQSTGSCQLRGRNTAKCKPSHRAKGHYVVGHPFVAVEVVTAVVAAKGTAIHGPLASQLRTSSIYNNDRAGRRCTGCRSMAGRMVTRVLLKPGTRGTQDRGSMQSRHISGHVEQAAHTRRLLLPSSNCATW